jgi:glycosyltransferase involved in cell wall biosynthesis
MSAATVLYVQPTSEVGGSEVALSRLIANLDRNRYHAVVVLPREGDAEAALEKAGAEIRIVPMEQLTASRNPLTQARYIARFAPASARMRSLAREVGAAVVHSNSLYALPASRTRGAAPLVWHIREIPSAPEVIRKRILSTADRRAARLVCVSRAVRAQFHSSRASVVHDGVDIHAFSPKKSGARIRRELGIADNVPVVGWAGRLDPWKGATVFVRMAEAVRSRFPDAVFVLCGGELRTHRGYAAELRSWTERRLNGGAKMTGWDYGPEDMPEVMAAFDILAHTPTAPEPFGLALIEAMASGKPVVAARAGGALDIVDDGVTGHLVEPGDVTGFTDAVGDLIRDQARRTAMGEAARRRCEARFDIRTHARNVQRIYDEVRA